MEVSKWIIIALQPYLLANLHYQLAQEIHEVNLVLKHVELFTCQGLAVHTFDDRHTIFWELALKFFGKKMLKPG